jgi:hypothetical protein
VAHGRKREGRCACARAASDGGGAQGVRVRRRVMRTVDGGEWRRTSAAEATVVRAEAKSRARNEREQMGREPAREKYDMWTPQFFLSSVDPTLRF